ncbi:MAG: N-acetylmuramoyl-L-alanine amidase [Clostridiaceae bacterium]|jgi:N-acetylmuramoyl-L-alanine amidase|nr:N-acetylmuramoyl-L-alanine amidase [Clostridiaceae bacterium]
MSNSSLVTYSRLAKWYSPRKGKISKIAIHHMAARWTAKNCVDFFARGSRYGSSQYCIGYDGSIGLSVPEDKRAWTTSSIWCDEQAVTIEVSNSIAEHPWPISDASYKALIYLIVDICRRNGIKDCTYTGTKEGVLQKHSWYAATPCPGPTLGALFPKISRDVNAMLKSGAPIPGISASMPVSSGGAKVEPYFAKVTVTDLNIRKTPNGEKTKEKLGLNDVVKITKESDGWGYTEGKGWISLKYTSKVQGVASTPTPALVTDALTAWIAKHHLKIGSEGELVGGLQAFLYARGYKISIDRKFGKETDDALKKYQISQSLDGDGIVGQKTWRAIFKEG